MKQSRFIKAIVKAWNLIRFEFRLIIPSFFFYLFGYVTFVGFYGLGDICYELCFLDAYIEKYKKKPRAVITKKRKAIFDFYPGIKKIGYLPASLEKLIVELGYNKFIRRPYLKIATHFNEVNKGSIFERVANIYKVDVSSKKTFPKPFKQEDIEIPQNSVLVIPDSNWYQSELIGPSINKIAQDFQKQGKHIFINGEKMKIEGAKNVFYSLNELLCNVHKFDAVISIRTGLLDFIINTDSRIVALLDNSEKGTIMVNDGLSLKYWDAKAKVFEYNVEETSVNEIEKKIRELKK